MKSPKNTFLETAWGIGTELMKESIWHNQQCNWTGKWIDVVNGEYKIVTRSFGADFYSGTSGIGHFLTCLYKETGDVLLKKTIEGTMEHIKGSVQNVSDHGFYSGKAGIAAVLVNTGAILQREDWMKAGKDLLANIHTDKIKDYEIDIISGISGSIIVLLDFYQKFNLPVYLDKAIMLGNTLLNKANIESERWSWATVPAAKNLTGFSHGVSGIANSLLQLYAFTGNINYYNAAKGGFSYEEYHFDIGQQNWPDYREGTPVSQSGKHNCGNAWCHGAPGIALSRVKAQPYIRNQSLETQGHVAFATTAKNTTDSLLDDLTNTNFSLCHGLAGNADILLESNQENYTKIAEMVGIAGIQKYRDQRMPWPSGLNTAERTPGMMMGTAGIGHFYLRLYKPKEFKTVLFPQL